MKKQTNLTFSNIYLFKNIIIFQGLLYVYIYKTREKFQKRQITNQWTESAAELICAKL